MQSGAPSCAAAGIFYGKFPYVWVSNQYSNTGVDFYTVTNLPTRFNPDPYGQAKAGHVAPSAEVNLTDPDFKAPSIFRWNLAFDYKLRIILRRRSRVSSRLRRTTFTIRTST